MNEPAMNVKKIAVLYNLVEEIKKRTEEEKLADDDNINSAKDVFNALASLGYEPTLFEVNCKTLHLLNNLKTDLIFNLLEGFADMPNSFPSITAYVEALGVPMTGTTSFSAFLTIDKARTKDYLVKNKVPTPNYQLFISPEESLKYSLRYPLITKPNCQDASLGITQDSVVKNFNELKERIAYIKETYGDATLAEEYIDGRELECFAINTGDDIVMLPILEGIFIPDPERKWDICDFEHKWGKKGYCDEEVPARLPEGIADEIYKITKDVRDIFDIKGYFRIDFRLSKDNTPYIVEVNTNPGFDHGVLKSKLKAHGMTYKQLVQMVMDAALYEFENKSSKEKSVLKGTEMNADL